MGNKFTVAVGDWSDDGHGKHTDFIVEVPDAFTSEILGENFAKNVAKLGFAPDAFAKDYEDSVLGERYLTALRALGFTAELDNEGDSDFIVEDGAVVLTEEDLLKIVMFYFGHGLDNFEWKNVNEQAPALIGYWSKVTKVSSVGYGLFY